MSNHLQRGVIFLAVASLASATNQMALATPEQSFGMSCVVCHSTPRDALHVNGDPGALPTFTVQAGSTVQLSFDVYREAGVYEEFEYILGVSGLDAPGFNPSLGSDWEYRSGDEISYVLKDEHKNPRTYTLDVAVDLSTPADLYYMEAIVAGHDEYENEDDWKSSNGSWGSWFPNLLGWNFVSLGTTSSDLNSSLETEIKWSDSQPFYLRVISSVVPEPSGFVLLLTMAVGLAPMRFRSSR